MEQEFEAYKKNSAQTWAENKSLKIEIKNSNA